MSKQIKQMCFTQIAGTVVFAPGLDFAQNLVMSEVGCVFVIDASGNSERHALPYGAILNVRAGDEVEVGTSLASWCSDFSPIIAETAGYVTFSDMLEGASLARQVDEVTGVTRFIVIEKEPKTDKLTPRLLVDDDKKRWIQSTSRLKAGTLIFVRNLAPVERGTVLAWVPN